MPHAHPLYIKQVKEHLAELTKSKKRNYESAQANKNGFLFTLDFLRSTYLDQKSSNLRRTLYILFMYSFMYFLWPPRSLYNLPPPTLHQNLHVPPFSIAYAKSIYHILAFPIPFPSNIITSPNSSQTMSSTSCNLLQEQPHYTSTTATTLYIFLNQSHFLLIISSYMPFYLLIQRIIYTLTLYHTFHSSQMGDKSSQFQFFISVIILKHPTPATSLLPFTLSSNRNFSPTQYLPCSSSVSLSRPNHLTSHHKYWIYQTTYPRQVSLI